MARSSSRTSKPAPITRSTPPVIIEIAGYRDLVEAATLAATGSAKKASVVERALDLYIRNQLAPPPTLADKRAHVDAIVDQGRKLHTLLSALCGMDQHRDFRADLDRVKTKSKHYLKILGRPETPLEPTIMREFQTTRDQLRHMLASAQWVREHLKKRPLSPAKVLVKKLASVVQDENQLRALLCGLNKVLDVIQRDFSTDDLSMSDPARLVRERKK